jgi:hypothetical protein
MFQDRIPKAWRRDTRGRFEALRPHEGLLQPDAFGERFRRAQVHIESQDSNAHALLEAYNIWNEVLESYSDSRLSHDEDKLVAISGLVKEIQSFIKDEYVVGFWKKHLVQQLLWKRMDSPPPRPNVRRPKVYCAPT